MIFLQVSYINASPQRKFYLKILGVALKETIIYSEITHAHIDEQHSRCLHHHSHLTSQLDQMSDREEYTALQIKGSVSMEL